MFCIFLITLYCFKNILFIYLQYNKIVLNSYQKLNLSLMYVIIGICQVRTDYKLDFITQTIDFLVVSIKNWWELQQEKSGQVVSIAIGSKI